MAFLCLEILIIDSVSSLVICLFRFSISAWLNLGRFWVSGILSIFYRSSNLLVYNCSSYSLFYFCSICTYHFYFYFRNLSPFLLSLSCWRVVNFADILKNHSWFHRCSVLCFFSLFHFFFALIFIISFLLLSLGFLYSLSSFLNHKTLFSFHLVWRSLIGEVVMNSHPALTGIQGIC